MPTENLNFLTVFFAGILAFLSPCILPILPAYLSFITGMSLEELYRKKGGRESLRRIIEPTLLFILGFTVVFVALGTTANATKLLPPWFKNLLERVAGVILIIFGLHFMGIIRIKFLDYQYRVREVRRKGGFSLILLGMAFAVGWTPCVGPILAAVFSLAAFDSSTVWQGVLYLLVFSAGLAIPFFASAVFLGSLINLFSRIKRHMRVVMVVCGSFLVVTGLFLLLRKFELIKQIFS
jgi:cytochrome c-type biogenesis protein